MKMLQIVKSDRSVIGEILRNASGDIRLKVIDENFRKPIEKLVEVANKDGVPLRSGQKKIVDGNESYVETLEVVESSDHRFLDALSDLLRGKKIAGQRVFGLLKQGDKVNE